MLLILAPSFRSRRSSDLVAFPPLRGRALGPAYVRGTRAPGAATSMMQLFLSGQPATIAANSNPSKGLRLKIYEADGKLVCDRRPAQSGDCRRSEEHTSELQSLMRISYAVFCLKKKKKTKQITQATTHDDSVRYIRLQ